MKGILPQPKTQIEMRCHCLPITLAQNWRYWQYDGNEKGVVGEWKLMQCSIGSAGTNISGSLCVRLPDCHTLIGQSFWAMSQMWRSEGNLCESFYFSFYRVDFGYHNHVSSLGGKPLYLVNHLVSPTYLILNLFLIISHLETFNC